MKKLFLFLCLGLSFLFVGCSNETITNNNNDVEETAEETTELSEEEYQASFNEFGKVYVTYTDTLNSYMQTIINSYSSDDLLTSYNNIKTIRDNVVSMDFNVLKKSSIYEKYKEPVEYLESYELIVFELSNLITKSYDKTLSMDQLTRVQELSTQSVTYSETCNKFANVFEKYIQ